jgi:cytochrome c-type biogenesis protein CcmH
MIQFLAAAAGLVILTLAAVAWPLLRGRGDEKSRAERDAAVFRDQLAELDRDVARGLISQAEARGTRAEISRRLIAASQKAERAERLGPAPRALTTSAGLGALLGMPLLALAVYALTGEPGRGDLPFAERPPAERRQALANLPGQPRMSQAEAEEIAAAERDAPRVPRSGGEEDEMLVRLERVLDDRPDDVEGRRLLADAYMRRGRFSEAAEVFGQIGRIMGPRATAEVFAERAEAMVLAAGGYVSPEAEDAISRALRIDESHPTARYYAGLSLAQRGRLEDAVRLWERLRAESPAGAPWTEVLDATLADARRAMQGGGGPGPSEADMAAAENMTPEERQAMIEGMVSGLEERLMAEGGSPEEWVRLLRARMQLGQPEAARRAYELSQDALRGSEAGFVREQALRMGVVEE